MSGSIYVAGGSPERHIVRGYIRKLLEKGWEVTHDWTQDPGYDNPSADNFRKAAVNDQFGVMIAAVFWLQMPEEKSEGGATELGMAIAAQRMSLGTRRFVIVSGANARRNLFCGLSGVYVFDNHDAAFNWIVGHL